jgi:hypothetical protein
MGFLAFASNQRRRSGRGQLLLAAGFSSGTNFIDTPFMQ